jgi:ubiquinone/menaquinone biosynthesis C-methylase UbiE
MSPAFKVTQCQKPSGWLGRLALRNMNSRHSKVTDWGLTHVSIGERDIILDVGCGGGQTVNKLADRASQGKITGIDFSAESVTIATKINQNWIDQGRVEIRQGEVSRLPFPDGVFDLVTAVETHFWWPDLPGDTREVLRVTKPGGKFVIIAEVYKGSEAPTAKYIERFAPKTGLKLLTLDEHRKLLEDAGCTSVQIFSEPKKGWICCVGLKPPA